MKWICTILLSIPALLLGQVVSFDQTSDPAGVIQQSRSVNSGAIVTTQTAPPESNGLRFTHWTINGTRHDHALSGALNQVSFTILEATSAIAHYLPEGEDTDADGVSDWYEIRYLGDLTHSASADGDLDNVPLSDEHQKGFSPTLADRLATGGIPLNRSAKIALVNSTAFKTFQETSRPFGTVDALRFVATGSSQSTLHAPDESNGLRFASWSIPASQAVTHDFLGSAKRVISLVVTSDVSAIAQYVPEGFDLDRDGVSDWFEWRYLGATNEHAASDLDLDGIPLSVERARGFNPTLHDRLVSGGTAITRSDRISISLGRPTYTITSSPVGIYDQQGTVASNTVVTTPLATPEDNGLRFGYWSVDGERIARSDGQAVRRVSQPITNDTMFIAHYYAEGEDVDGDGVADWYEWLHLGDLDSSATDDSDLDGISLATELDRGFNPRLKNELKSGGVVINRSERAIVDLQFFLRETRALNNDVVTAVFSDTPYQPDGWNFGAPTHPGLGDWDGDDDLDLFVMIPGDLAVFENIGSRFALNLSDRSSVFTPPANASRIALGDWNQDGLADIVYATTNVGCFALKASIGVFDAAISGFDLELMPLAGQVIDPAIGDLTDDGLPDLLGLMADGTVHLYPHTGNNGAPYAMNQVTTNLLNQSVPHAASISVADVNFDGVLDLLISDQSGRVWDYRAQGNSYVLRSRIWGGSGEGFASGLDLALGDLDGDGDADAIAGFGEGGLMLLRDPKMARPLNLMAFGAQDSVRLEWLPAYQSRIKGYHVYRATNPAADFPNITPNPVDTARYLDASISGAANYFYYVTAVTEFFFPGFSFPRPVESPPSDLASTLAGSTRVKLADACGVAGGEAVLQIKVDHITGVVGNGMEIRLAYDPLKLTPITQIDAQRATALKTAISSGITISDNGASANGELVITASGTSELFGSGHLLDLVFQVSPSALAGSTTSYVMTGLIFKNALQQTLSVDFSGPGTLHIEANFIRGDINTDGLLDARDLTLLLQLAAGLRDATPAEVMAADLNGNGRLDANDAQLLHRLIRGAPLNP